MRTPPGGLGAHLRERLLAGRRAPGLRTAKTTLAAVVAFAVAERLETSPDPVLAPLTALLVVQLTLYQTVAHGWERIASVTSGVLVALGVANVVGLTWWSLGLVVAVSLVIGRLLRLGPHLPEVAISAMLVLAVGGSGAGYAATDRVYETLIGAAVGIVVNLVIAPPLYMQPAGEAIADVSRRLADLMRGLAGAIAAGWSRADADHWLEEARGLGGLVARADRVLARAEESARLNPRGARAREVQPRLRTSLTALEHTYVSLRSLCRAMLDRAYFVAEDEPAATYTPEVRSALAEALLAAADAVERVVGVTARTPAPEIARLEVLAHLDELRRRRDRLSLLLRVDPTVDEGAWQQHGALLAALDRIRVEVEAAVRLRQEHWRPAPLTERQRRAVRRVVDSRRRRRQERRGKPGPG